jgi:malonyl CoA-acyl carrier protein transacylase
MLALLGASDARAHELALEHGVAVANLNAPGQIVLSGPADALFQLAADARDEGYKALELGVAGAFHSPAMAPSVPPFAAALESAPFRTPRTTVFSGLTAQPMGDPRKDLADALTGPVRWTDTMLALAQHGIDTFVDAGPGRVLQKLAKRIVPELARA